MSSAPYSLRVTGLGKSFNRRMIFSGISFELQGNQSITITGRNGSGKSTLMKIIAGVLAASRGDVGVSHGGTAVSKAELHTILGFVSPYLQLYDEFSGAENLELAQEIRGSAADRSLIRQALDRVGLGQRGNDLLRTYSSGMKQRLKYAAALIHRPPILLLDEPTSNLDDNGKAIVHEIIREQREHGLLIVATNERDELGLCDSILVLDEEKKGGSRS